VVKLKKGDHVLFRRLGDTNLYHEVVEREAVNERNNRRVVFLQDGTWTYLTNIVEVNHQAPPVEWGFA
jgi:hypothetical protein